MAYDSKQSANPITTFGEIAENSSGTNVSPVKLDFRTEIPKEGLGEFFARPRKVASFDITLNSFFIPIAALISLSDFATIYRKYRLFRGDLKIKVSYTGSSNFLGMGRIFAYPTRLGDNYVAGTTISPVTHTTPVNVAVAMNTQLPHVDIDFSLTSTQMLDLVYPLADPWMQTTVPIGTDWILYYAAVNPIQTANGLTAPASAIEVWAYYENTEQMVLNPYVAQGAEMPSDFIGRMRSYVDGLGKFGLSAYTAPVSKVMEIGESVARFFGYSRPAVEPQDVIVVKTVSNYSVASGQPNFSYTLGLDTCAVGSVDKRRIPLSKTDDTQFKSIISREVQMVANWAEGVATAIDVAPGSIWRTSPNMIMTPLAFAASFFQYWCGSIDYCFEVISSPLIRWRVGIVVVPPSLAIPATFPAGGDYVTYVVDVAGSTTFDFSVPYMGYAAMTPFVFSHYTNVLTTNPKIVYFSLATPTGPAATPVVPKVNLYVKGGKDFQCGVPTLAALAPYTPALYVEQTGTMSLPASLFGEQVEDLNLLVKRFAFLEVGAASAEVMPVSPSVAIPTINWTFVTYLRLAYLGEVGSFEYKMSGPHTVPMLVKNTTSTTTSDSTRGLQAFPTSSIVEFRVPYRSPKSFRQTGKTKKNAVEKLIITGTAPLEIAGMSVVVAGSDDYIVGGYLCAPPLVF